VSRIVFQLGVAQAPDGQFYLSIALDEPSVFGSGPRPFTCLVSDPAFVALKSVVVAPNSVQAAGSLLFSAVSAHPEIQLYLQTALQTVAGQRYPVYVEIAAPGDAEAFPWEALCSPTGDYLGLDERWALARIVDAEAELPTVYTLQPPLRIAAVLSCLGISAAGELAALRAAIRQAGAGAARLLVIASEEQLIADLRDEVTAGTAPEVEAVEVIPPDLSALQQLVSDFGPHVLHLFCHGSIEGEPHVSLALKEDWETPEPTSGLLAEAAAFHRFTRKTDGLPWLVVLNCCEGAAPGAGADAQSLTLRVASQGVAPAVIGMREPVVSTTANLLTQTLYPKLLAEIAAGNGGGQRPIDWACLVAAVRDRLRRTTGMTPGQAAASSKEWTMPVIYVSPDGFQLRVEPPPAPAQAAREPGPVREARLEIEALQALLAALPPDQAAALKTEAGARIGTLSRQLGLSEPVLA
jgi:hypothetical protein